jgi:hypothetical protein
MTRRDVFLRLSGFFVAVPALTLVGRGKARADGGARDLVLEDLSFSVDGKVLADRAGSIGGKLVWVSSASEGEFLIVTAPPEGRGFRKAGRVRGKRLRFVFDGRHYVLTSTEPILRDGGSADIWIRYNYPPTLLGESNLAFGSQSPIEQFFEKH